MKASEFLAKIDEERVVKAIGKAEESTSGEIRVYVSDKQIQNALERATLRFQKLGMHKTRLRNAVLLYFAPRARQFALVGDQGVHQACGQAFWDETVERIRGHLKQENFTEAIVLGVQTVGDLLARHFPKEDNNPNELPNDLLRD